MSICLSCHDPILSRNGVSGNPGAVHCWAATDTCEALVDVCAPAGDLDWGITIRTLALHNVGNGYKWAVGTSASTALAAGVAALTWAANPGYSAEEIKSAMRMYAKTSIGNQRYLGTRYHSCHQFVQDYESNCPWEQQIDWPPVVWPDDENREPGGEFDFDSFISVVFGSGMPDAADLVNYAGSNNVYRVYGGVLSESMTLDDADIVKVYGDLTIPNGVSLALDAGMPAVSKWIIMDHDFQSDGVNTAKIEIIVEDGGAIVPDATDVQMISYEYGPEPESGWWGLEVQDGGVFGASNDRNWLYLYGADEGVRVFSQTLYVSDITSRGQNRALVVDNVVEVETVDLRCFNASGVALELGGDAELSVDGGTQSVIWGSGLTGVRMFNGAVLTGEGSLSVSDVSTGVSFMAGTSEVNLDLEIDTTVGFSLSGWSEATFGGTVDVNGSTIGGTLQGNCTLVVSSGGSITVDGAYYGVTLNSGAEVACAGETLITDSLVHGIYASNCQGCNLACDGGEFTVELSAQDGLRLDGTSSVEVEGLVFFKNVGNGIGVHNTSSANIRQTVLNGNGIGLLVNEDATANAGTTQDYGNNEFRGNKLYHAVNFIENSTVSADGNSWTIGVQLTCPPDASDLVGLFSTACQ